MEKQSAILIVSASAGTGHVRAGEALRKAFALREPRVSVEHVDVLDLAPRWVRIAYGGGFELVAARAPWLWKRLYERTDGALDYDARWGVVAERLLFREFSRLLRSRPWRACLCTHFLPAQLVAGRPGFPPFATVVTDFVLHRYWVQPGVRQYFVATEHMVDDLNRRRPEVRAMATGIPVDPAFAAAPSREEARAELGLEQQRPVALVMGGGLGIGVEDNVEAALRAQVPGLQVVAICGRNAAARERLGALSLAPERLRVYGFVSGIERFFAAADIVVTKPGGLTTSEALAVGRPLLLTRPIPGQEEGNARAVVAAGAALLAPDPAALRQALERVFNEPAALERLSAAAAALGRPNAAFDIVSAVGSRYLADMAA